MPISSGFVIFKSLAERNKTTLDFSCNLPAYSMHFDRERMEKILHNVLSNAFKFTPDGGKIQVTAGIYETEKRKNTLSYFEIMVSDTGIGIPEEYLKNIFNPYYQVPGTEYGTGLGLAITRKLVEAHGGNIHVESREGEGTTFTVFLPCGEVQ